MKDEAILRGLAEASRAIRRSESSAQTHDTEERQNARRALICADAAAESLAKRWRADPEAMAMAMEQANANRPHYAEHLAEDWEFIMRGTDTRTVECHLVIEGQSMAQSYECRRGEVDQRGTPCLACFFTSGYVGDVMQVLDPGVSPNGQEGHFHEAVQQATIAMRHLRAAALETPDTTYEPVLLAMGDCAHFVIEAIERGQGERTQPKLRDDEHGELANAYAELQETLVDRMGSPQRWLER